MHRRYPTSRVLPDAIAFSSKNGESDERPLLSPRAKTTTPFKHQKRNLWWEITWRWVGALVFSALILVLLDRFSKLGALSSWQKRWFNVLSITLSSLVSLCIGSLIGFLGNMMRWPILAGQLRTPMDVDLILGMSNPTGALRLLRYHLLRNWAPTATTAIVAVYLLINIVARLSVAAFGLTYDLNEKPDIYYPVKVTDWSVRDWFNLDNDTLQGTFADWDDVNPSFMLLNNHATMGLMSLPTDFDSSDKANYTLSDPDHGLERRVDGNKLTYSYKLKEYTGLKVNLSQSNVIHSSASCIGRSVVGQDVYETSTGKQLGSLEGFDSSGPGYMKILSDVYLFFDQGHMDYLWAAPMEYGEFYSDDSGCFSTYLHTSDGARDMGDVTLIATYFECTACLAHSRDGQHIGGIGDDVLHGLPPANTTYVANLLLRLGIFERVYSPSADDPNIAIREYSAMNKFTHFAANLYSGFPKDNGAITQAILDETFNDTNYPDNGIGQAELHAAHLAARLPILAIAGAESQLPKVSQKEGDKEHPFVEIVLEVRWARAYSVLAALLLGQIVLIAIVVFGCRKVLLRDHDSYLSVARLLKRTMEQVDGQSAATGKQIAEYLQESGGISLKYGTRKKEDFLEVDMWNDVSPEFARNASYD